ncbi:hypothetical protein JCM19000A_18300 [Silvimonas sp. JCM 19000]
MSEPDANYDSYLQGSYLDAAWSNKRNEARYLVNWRVAIVYQDKDSHLSFRGRAFDIGMGGFSLHSDYSLPVSDRVTVLISVPAAAAGMRARIVEVKSRVVYTVLSSEFDGFRTGVYFTEFKGDGEALLKHTLAGRVAAPIASRPD